MNNLFAEVSGVDSIIGQKVALTDTSTRGCSNPCHEGRDRCLKLSVNHTSKSTANI
jgi:hypothetical protein